MDKQNSKSEELKTAAAQRACNEVYQQTKDGVNKAFQLIADTYDVKPTEITEFAVSMVISEFHRTMSHWAQSFSNQLKTLNNNATEVQ